MFGLTRRGSYVKPEGYEMKASAWSVAVLIYFRNLALLSNV